MRLFIAINLPPDERRLIREATAELRDGVRGVTWVAEEKLHLTLKFLGEHDESVVPALRDALAAAAARHRAIALELGGIGTFPNPRDPRVVWLGVEHDPKLELLQHDVETACERLGYEVEGRPFRPHVTLGRVKSRDREQARAIARLAHGVQYTGTVEVRSVDLMSSVLSAAGSGYELLGALPLGGR